MAFDAHRNLAISTVATAPAPAGSGTALSVAAGEGARFPAAPFNATVWQADALPTPANAELVRVTAIAGDAFTLERGTEGSPARAVLVGDLIAATITVKTIADIESGVNFPQIVTAGTIKSRGTYASISNSVSASIPNATFTTVPFNTENVDVGGLFDPAQPNKLTIPVGAAGVYLIAGTLTWAGGSAGQRQGLIDRNGANLITNVVGNGGGIYEPQNVIAFSALLNDGDVITMRCYQDNGSALSLSPAKTILTATRLN